MAIPTYAEALELARHNVALRIAEVTLSPKPSYSFEGKSVSWNEYLSTLNAQLEKLTAAIALAAGPYQVAERVLG